MSMPERWSIWGAGNIGVLPVRARKSRIFHRFLHETRGSETLDMDDNYWLCISLDGFWCHQKKNCREGKLTGIKCRYIFPSLAALYPATSYGTSSALNAARSFGHYGRFPFSPNWRKLLCPAFHPCPSSFCHYGENLSAYFSSFNSSYKN
jgi:hypothetical protein